MSDYLSAAVEIAREAGALLAELFAGPLEIRYKRRSDLVTEADRRSEALILERLRRLFPEHGIVAEESGSHPAASDYCWYVDPLDGTTNYAHGFPVYCVSMGLACREEVIAGVVFDPTHNDLYAAERGAGAFRNGGPIHVSRIDELSRSLVATGFPPFGTNHGLNLEFYSRFTRLSHGVRRAGSAALDLAWVAAGRFDGFWEMKLNPWDKAAGALLVAEAGGRVSDMHGGPFSLHGDEVLASNGLIHAQMLEVFAGVLAEHPPLEEK